MGEENGERTGENAMSGTDDDVHINLPRQDQDVMNVENSEKPTVPSPHHAGSRGRWKLVATILVLGALVGTWFLLGRPIPAASMPRQTLTTGVAPGGTRWRLSSKLNDNTLCLSVDIADNPKHPNAYSLDGGGGGCGFDNTRLVDHQYSFLLGSTTQNGSDLMMFAPAPANAVRVQVAEHQSVPTHAIPGFFYKGVRYWYFAYPKNWPNSASGEECDSLFDSQHPAKGHCKIQAYDKNGEVVPFGNHYLDPNSEL
ncbi:MAG: hypothetical protein ABF489_07805 [Bifidobacterium sp.]|uniref:hypothetical protein n=1 Tax=Bifidobacterium sp. TaxID=41200 RepID=UPI0039EA10CD